MSTAAQLDPDLALLLAQLKAMPALETLSAADARALVAALSAASPPGPALPRVEDRSIPGPAGPVPLRIYWGHVAPAAIMVYFHSGGWVLGSLDGSDAALRDFALQTALCIVSVDYRLAPEHRFPAAVDDSVAALAWVAAARAELAGVDARLLVGGDSAGGNLAAVAAIAARDNGGPAIAGQLLFYPVTAADFDTASYRAKAEGYFLTRPMMQWFWNHYVPDAAERSDPRASPLATADLSGLPPALIQTAGHDPLCDEGEAFAARLAAAGTVVTLQRYDTLIHGYFGMGQIKACNAAIAAAAAWVSAIASRSSPACD